MKMSGGIIMWVNIILKLWVAEKPHGRFGSEHLGQIGLALPELSNK